MKTALLVHGAYGNPEENWLPWLRLQLESLGYTVVAPVFPTPDGQDLETWMNIAKPHIESLDSESIVIGHSIGATFLLSVLEQLNEPIATAAFVSGFIGSLGNETFDPINKSFAEKQFNWDTITSSAKKFIVFHGSDDPYVPTQKSEELSAHLGTETQFIVDGGHLNEAAGFVYFSKLLEQIITFVDRKALVAPLNSSGQMFIQDRRGYKKPDWGYFGGAVEHGEDPVQAAVREMKEELDIDRAPSDLTQVPTSIIPTETGSIIRYTFLYTTDQQDFTVLEGSGGEWLDIDTVRTRFAGQPGLHTLDDIALQLAQQQP